MAGEVRGCVQAHRRACPCPVAACSIASAAEHSLTCCSSLGSQNCRVGWWHVRAAAGSAEHGVLRNTDVLLRRFQRPRSCCRLLLLPGLDQGPPGCLTRPPTCAKLSSTSFAGRGRAAPPALFCCCGWTTAEEERTLLRGPLLLLLPSLPRAQDGLMGPCRPRVAACITRRGLDVVLPFRCCWLSFRGASAVLPTTSRDLEDTRRTTRGAVKVSVRSPRGSEARCGDASTQEVLARAQ
jgi:hypothetical protein